MTDEWITIDLELKVDPLAPADLAIFMVTRDHWFEVWPDARERWTWVYWMARCGMGRRTRLVSPPFVHANGRRWRVIGDDVAAWQVADRAILLSGRLWDQR